MTDDLTYGEALGNEIRWRRDLIRQLERSNTWLIGIMILNVGLVALLVVLMVGLGDAHEKLDARLQQIQNAIASIPGNPAEPAGK